MNPISNNSDGIGGLSGTPKTMFVLGLSVGIGGMAVIALIFGMTVFMQGTSVLASGDDKTGAQVPAADAGDTVAADTGDTQPIQPVDPVTDADHVRGSANAAVTLIEYSDFECPYCSSHESTMEQILADYPNDIRIVYRHFPLSFHPSAGIAAEASECAANQGKFWEMHDELFVLADSATGLTEEGIRGLAGKIGLNEDTFNACLDNGDTYADVSDDYQGGIAAGVAGTPATFVNGQMVEGAVPYATFKQIVESEGAQS